MGYTEQDNFQDKKEIQINDSARRFLTEAARWAKLLSIVTLAFIIISSIFSMFGKEIMYSFEWFRNLTNGYSVDSDVIGNIVFEVIWTIICFIPVYYLYSFAKKTLNALKTDDSHTLSEAFNFLSKHNAFITILSIIIVAIILLIVILFILLIFFSK